MNWTIFPKSVWVAVLVGLAVMLYKSKAVAEPLFAAEAQNGERVVVDSEPCIAGEKAIPLKKATYTKGDVKVAGCVAFDPRRRIFIFYWADETDMEVPLQYFNRIHQT